MSAIFTKGVETEPGGRGASKKDKLFHNNHRKHSPSDSPGGPRRPPRRVSPEADVELKSEGAPQTDQTWALQLGDELADNKGTLAPRVVCVVWLLWGEGESEMAGMFPNAVARPSRERLPANSASTIPAKSSLPAQPGQPGRPAHGQQHPPLPFSPRCLPSPAQGAQSWGAVQCRLCLEADVIPTPYSAVFPGGPQGRFSSSSRSWGTGNVSPSPLPTPQPNTHTSSTPVLPGRVKKKKKMQLRQSYETGWWGRYTHAEGANARTWA